MLGRLACSVSLFYYQETFRFMTTFEVSDKQLVPQYRIVMKLLKSMKKESWKELTRYLMFKDQFLRYTS